MGDISRIHDLSQYTEEFNAEYYGDNAEAIDALEVVAAGIMNDNIYQWNLNDEICAIAQAMHDQFDFPVIGNVFTPPNHRGKGYATSIVYSLTKGLLSAGNEKCMLVADAYNPASNKAFIKVGYLLTGEYVVRYKLK